MCIYNNTIYCIKQLICIFFLFDCVSHRPTKTSFRSTLCLQYSPYQLALAFVFMAITIIGLQPTARGGANAGSASIHHHNSSGNSQSDVTWIDIVDKDVDEAALQEICFSMVDLYAAGFTPAETPYVNQASLRESLPKQLGALNEVRKEAHANIYETPSFVVGKGFEENKGAGDDNSPHKCKQEVSPTHIGHNNSAANGNANGNHATSSSSSSSGGSTAGASSGRKFSFKTLPPPFLSTDLPPPALPPSSSPCHDAATPRSTYRPTMCFPLHNQQLTSGIASVPSPTGVEGECTPELAPPPPESPMSSSYSTFSQIAAQTQRERGVLEAKQSQSEDGDGDVLNTSELSPAGSTTDTPNFMPPPTPDSMACTPNFENLPPPGSYCPDGLPSSKKPRVEY